MVEITLERDGEDAVNGLRELDACRRVTAHT
jgi:hypothetical protein